MVNAAFPFFALKSCCYGLHSDGSPELSTGPSRSAERPNGRPRSAVVARASCRCYY